MRARPGKVEDEGEREFAPRLAKQMTRLSRSLAAVCGETEVNDSVGEKVWKIATDTAGGGTLDMVKLLVRHPPMNMQSLELYLNRSADRLRTQLKFLAKIGVIQKLKSKSQREKPRWTVSDKIEVLYRDVVGE